MKTLRLEALPAARRLCRSLSAAPDPRQRVRKIVSTLLHAEGWSATDEAAILEFNRWVDTRPPVGTLKARCEALRQAL
ncbi:hypothetical protein CFHF_19560 [Caulobacter flavus]|nr:hypothetical protein CFHF_19560 [Caulobacter flavus]